MEWTDQHQRFLFRQISTHALLYTEMIHAEAIIQGPYQRLLAYHADEQPLACQIGGNEPSRLALATRMVGLAGYHEVNLNLGCPSPRVQQGAFGACLMNEPQRVIEALQAMQDVAAGFPMRVTVKLRLGTDGWQESDGRLIDFIGGLADKANIRIFILHARLGLLKKLTPKQNREIPPLDYEQAARVARKFPDNYFILNGGIIDMTGALALQSRFSGVMVGRAAYHNPLAWSELDATFFGQAEAKPFSLATLCTRLAAYIDERLHDGYRFNEIARHLLPLANGKVGAKLWRQGLTNLNQNPHAKGDDLLRLAETIGWLENPMTDLAA